MKKLCYIALLLPVGGWISGMSPAAGDLLVASFNTDSILRYDDQTGAFIDTLASGNELDRVTYMTLGPDGNVYVSSTNTDCILRYDSQTGALIDTFVCDHVFNPAGLTFGPDGDLYLLASNLGGGWLQHFDGQTGIFMETLAFVPSVGLADDLSFGPDGNLYLIGCLFMRYDFATENLDILASVCSSHMSFGPDDQLYLNQSERIDRYDWQTGNFIDTFASGGGLSFSSGLIFGLDGNLYVGSSGTDSVLRYSGQAGDFIDTFASGGGLDGPMALVFTSQPAACALLGDVDEDGMVDGEDILGFLECLLTGGSAVGNCGCADIDGLGGVDINDVDLFVSLMLRSCDKIT